MSAQWMVKVEEGIAELRGVAEGLARRIEEVREMQEAVQPATEKAEYSPETEARFVTGLITSIEDAYGVKIKLDPAVPKDEIRMVSPGEGVPLTMRTGIIEDVWAAPSSEAREAGRESVRAGMDKTRLEAIRMTGDVVPIDLHDRLVARAKKLAQGEVARSVLTAVEHEMNEARCEVDTRVQADAALPVMERNPGHLAVFNAAYMQGMARALQAVRRELGTDMPGWTGGAQSDGRVQRKRRPGAEQG